MPILNSMPGDIVAVVAAQPGWRVDAFAPRGSVVTGVPTPSHVVAWALIADSTEAGGAIVEPVFFAGERTWTPAQFQARYGETLTLKVVPA